MVSAWHDHHQNHVLVKDANTGASNLFQGSGEEREKTSQSINCIGGLEHMHVCL